MALPESKIKILTNTSFLSLNKFDYSGHTYIWGQQDNLEAMIIGLRPVVYKEM